MKRHFMYMEEPERFRSIRAPHILKSLNLYLYTFKNFLIDMTLPQIPIKAPIKISNPDT